MSKSDQILNDLSVPNHKWKTPCLIAIFGFPGAGKTAIADQLSSRYPFVCLTTDAIRLWAGNLTRNARRRRHIIRRRAQYHFRWRSHDTRVSL